MSSSLSEHFVLPDNPHLGDRILYRMRVVGYRTKGALAEKVGCTTGTLSKMINSGNCYNGHRLKLIAWHLNTTTDWLLGRVPEEGKKISTCDKSFCGENAKWSVRRQGQHPSVAAKSCDNHVVHFVSRDHRSEVMPLEKFLAESSEKPVEIVGPQFSSPVNANG